MGKINSAEQAREEMVEAINKAAADEKFMVAIWSVRNGRVELTRVSYDFPVNDMLKAAALMTINAHAEVEAVANAKSPPFAPLKPAELGPRLAVTDEEPATPEDVALVESP